MSIAPTLPGSASLQAPHSSAPAVPQRFQALLARLEAVRPDCARVATLSIAGGEANGAPYDVGFLREFVARMERQSAPEPGGRVPAEPRPYTVVDFRRHVEASFKRSEGHWDVLVDHDPEHVGEVLALTEQLIGRLASWGLHAGDVLACTKGPEGEPAPHDHTRAIGSLVSGSARLAKTLADFAAGRYRAKTGRRLERDLANMAEVKEGARRVLGGGPFQLPRPQVERVGSYRTWWALLPASGSQPAVPAQQAEPCEEDTRSFRLKQGSLPVTRAAREDVLGPFATKRLAGDAGKRATATAEDSRVGLFAHLGAGSLF